MFCCFLFFFFWLNEVKNLLFFTETFVRFVFFFERSFWIMGQYQFFTRASFFVCIDEKMMFATALCFEIVFRIRYFRVSFWVEHRSDTIFLKYLEFSRNFKIFTMFKVVQVLLFYGKIRPKKVNLNNHSKSTSVNY